MKNVIIHLIGKPGVGKYTVGTHIAGMTGARLVDNHSVANVIFNLIPTDGVSPLPKEIWPRVTKVRAAVLDTLLHVSPQEMSFVFTNFIRGEDPGEYEAFLELVAVAEARESTFVPVILSCQTTELLRRIVAPSRRERMKLVDPAEGARLNDTVPEFETDHPNTLRLDVTNMDAPDTSRIIVEWADRCSRRI